METKKTLAIAGKIVDITGLKGKTLRTFKDRLKKEGVVIDNEYAKRLYEIVCVEKKKEEPKNKQ